MVKYPAKATQRSAKCCISCLNFYSPQDRGTKTLAHAGSLSRFRAVVLRCRMSVLTMVQRIEAEREDRKLGEIKELNLEGCSATEVEGLTDEYTCLEKLNMSNVGLTTLAGLPALPALTHLDVSGNPISAGLEALTNCPRLVSVNLSGNKLAAIADLAPLASLESLSHLEMSDCELVSVEGYRKEVFALLPHLKFLDGLDQSGVEEVNEKVTGEVVNGPKNGHIIPTANEEADDEDDEEDDQGEDEDEEDEEEEIGISALQGSKDLEDDEEDYVPGNGDEDAEDDEEDDEEDEDEEGEGENVEEEVANLSGSGVTDSRRAQKRPADDSDAVGVSEAKVAATEDN
uniref:Acidic leucine rich nuclear phosphoprotein n=2 Tax=Echinococcus granulosus TaxID=6210 RepID=A0A068X490_ECHGR|nr:Acidic leucine rich nuclear phosphoprotein [Echinococcus granulosus]